MALNGQRIQQKSALFTTALTQKGQVLFLLPLSHGSQAWSSHIKHPPILVLFIGLCPFFTIQMCLLYYYKYPSCNHTSALMQQPCEAAYERQQFCAQEHGIEPVSAVCDEPCPQCIGSAPAGFSRMPTVPEEEEEESLISGTPLRTRPGRQQAASVAGSTDYHAVPQPAHTTPARAGTGEHRWPLQDEVDDDEHTNVEHASSHASTSRRTTTAADVGHRVGAAEDHGADDGREAERQRREAELEEAEIEAAVQASLLSISSPEAEDHVLQLVEQAKQLSLLEAERNPIYDEAELARAAQRSEQDLPDDLEKQIQEAKRLSMWSLGEEFKRQRRLQKSTAGSMKGDGGTAGQERAFRSSYRAEAGPSKAAYQAQARPSVPQGAAYTEPAGSPTMPTAAVHEHWSRSMPRQTSKRPVRSESQDPAMAPQPGGTELPPRPPSPALTIRTSEQQRAAEDHHRERLYHTHPGRPPNDETEPSP